MKTLLTLLCWLSLLGLIFAQGPQRVRQKIQTTDGKVLEGILMNQTSVDLQLQTDDQRIHLLRATGDRFREVTSQVDWPTYHGTVGGNRFSTMDQINRTNVARLAPKWIFTMAGDDGTR